MSTLQIPEQYALVARGGHVPGQRPRTKLVAIDQRVDAERGRHYRGWILNSAGKRTKTRRRIEMIDIVKVFHSHYPSPAEIAKAKRALEVRQ